ncbi:putative membrane protein [Paramicrobacterium humi]|uniref:Putative membrane protein n=1 Tax=Paramicrobacterium humi TaxID=640635 RepID=A0A1H4PGE5_9MICO|nr:hypothetical protein [Microbacterium humi]SEC06401.1 putative membrane protein [Microbacterium humi]
MLTSALATALAVHGPWVAGPGFGWWFLLIPLSWIVVLALLFTFVFRRRRGAWRAWQEEHSPVRSAESTLAQRYANGDIDETEYRARLEVLRANARE